MSVPVSYYVIGAIVVIAIIIAIVAAIRASRSRTLARRFGPEYERTVRAHGDRAAAERDLAQREARVKTFHLEELPVGARQRYAEEWRAVQSRFLDEPRRALVQADHLVANVMRDRGYPLDDYAQREADLSPDHPHVVRDFRLAHAVAERSGDGEVGTEDLRQAMVHYRAVFDDLVGGDVERTQS
jgi:hypothetical protein